MAKTDIRSAPTKPSEAPTQLVPTGAAEVAGYDADSYDDVQRDISVPVLGLINGIGKLAEKYTNKAGNYVLGEVFLGQSVEVIPVSVVKFLRETVRDGEVLAFDAPDRKIFATAAEAKASGYYIDFDNVVPNRCEEAAKIGYLVIAPEGDDSGEFVIKAGELRLAQGKSSYQRGGFREVFRRVFDHAAKQALLKDVPTAGLNHTELFSASRAWTHRWKLYAALEKGRKNSWWEPRIAKGAPLSEATVQYITDHYGK